MPLFPGACFRLRMLPKEQSDNATPRTSVFLVFRSGLCVITGNKCVQDARSNFSYFVEKVLRHVRDASPHAVRSSAKYRAVLERLTREDAQNCVVSSKALALDGFDDELWNRVKQRELRDGCIDFDPS